MDAVLCAGDLFDDPFPEPEWWQGLIRLLKKWDWSSRPVFLLPGNHDPLTANSVYDSSHPFRAALPHGVHVVDRRDFCYEISAEAVLYATPCTSKAGEQDLASQLPLRGEEDPRIRIGMVHGQTFDIPGSQTNFPIAKDAATQRGLDYLAVGDTHAFREVPPGAVVPTIYPGTPEQTRFGEQETGFVSLVCFRRTGRKPIIEKHAVGRWVWKEERYTDLASLRRLRDRDDLDRTVLRLNVDMSVTLQEYDEVNSILNELKGTTAAHGRVGVMQIDRTRLSLAPTSVDEFPPEMPDILKKVVQRLQQGGEHAEVANRALYHLYKTVRGS